MSLRAWILRIGSSPISATYGNGTALPSGIDHRIWWYRQEDGDARNLQGYLEVYSSQMQDDFISVVLYFTMLGLNVTALLPVHVLGRNYSVR